jgi:hypothetical protein
MRIGSRLGDYAGKLIGNLKDRALSSLENSVSEITSCNPDLKLGHSRATVHRLVIGPHAALHETFSQPPRLIPADLWRVDVFAERGFDTGLP